MRKLLVCLFFSVVVSCAAGVLDNIVVSCAAGLLDNMIANVSKTKNIQRAPYECYYAGVDSISEFVILKSSSNNMFVLAPELLDSIKNETTESDVVNSYGAGIVSLDFYECFMRCFPPKEYGRLINMPYDPVSPFRYKEFEMNKNFQIVKPENKIDAFIVILVRGESYNRYRIPRIISNILGICRYSTTAMTNPLRISLFVHRRLIISYMCLFGRCRNDMQIDTFKHF